MLVPAEPVDKLMTTAARTDGILQHVNTPELHLLVADELEVMNALLSSIMMLAS